MLQILCCIMQQAKFQRRKMRRFKIFDHSTLGSKGIFLEYCGEFLEVVEFTLYRGRRRSFCCDVGEEYRAKQAELA